jgi:chromosome segregation protein
VAAALDAAARHVVVAESESAVAGLRLLAGRDGPRVVFAALVGGDGQRERAAEQFRAVARAALEGLPGWRLASDLVRSDAAHEALCARYLGTTLVVDTLATALAAYERLLPRPDRPAEFQVVTQEGVVIRSAGEWAAGRDGRDAHLLAYQRELRALGDELAASTAAAETAQRALADAEQAAADAVAAAEAARESLAAAEAARRDAEQAERLAAHELAGAQRDARRLEAGLAAESQAQAAQQAEAERLAVELAALTAGEADRQAVLRGATDALEAADADAAAAGEAEATARTALAVAAADERSARELAERAAAEARRLAAEHDGLLRQAAEADAAASALAAEQERLDRRLAALAAEMAPLQRELRTLQDVAEAAATERQRLDEAARRLQRDLRATDEAHAAATLAAERAGDALAALRREQAALAAELGTAAGGPAPVQLALLAPSPPQPPSPTRGEGGAVVTLTPTLSPAERGWQAVLEQPLAVNGERAGSPTVVSPSPPGGRGGQGGEGASIDLEDLARRLAARQRELRAVGAVDASALDEYQAVLERQRFAESQIADLEAASAAIRKGIVELQVRMRERFQEVFAAVDAAFGECFQALFGGGTARLEIAAGDDVLTAGVEVIAQPPGKRAHSLHTLSGGERALAAAALLFALLRVQPSPFCVLDEVDAALDEANVQRFAALLRAQAAHTQFLVITHNRGTMEIADALYGVTMVDNAVSQVASVRLADLPPNPDDHVLN